MLCWLNAILFIVSFLCTSDVLFGFFSIFLWIITDIKLTLWPLLTLTSFQTEGFVFQQLNTLINTDNTDNTEFWSLASQHLRSAMSAATLALVSGLRCARVTLGERCHCALHSRLGRPCMSAPAGQKIVTSNPPPVEKRFSISSPSLSIHRCAPQGVAGIERKRCWSGSETAPRSVCVFPLCLETPHHHRVSEFSFLTFLLSLSGSRARTHTHIWWFMVLIQELKTNQNFPINQKLQLPQPHGETFHWWALTFSTGGPVCLGGVHFFWHFRGRRKRKSPSEDVLRLSAGGE